MDGLIRWRIVLGQAAQNGLGNPTMSGYEQACEAALGYLYDREADKDNREISKEGGTEASVLSVPDWINRIHELFPKATIERLEKDAVERYHIDEVVTNPDVLSRIEPNETLLRAVLRTKHLMNPQVLSLARDLVARVVRELMEKLALEYRQAFSGAVRRRAVRGWRTAANFDARKTIRANLQHWSPQEKRLFIQTPHFFSRHRRHSLQWQIILVVDQSGSMVGNVIHAAVTAACLWSLPSIKTHLVAFDTAVVDLTDSVSDPVEALMQVQLGGGTDIAQAMQYAAQLVENPRRTIVVLITDFFEGGDAYHLVRHVKRLCDQGTWVLGLAALDEAANPVYDRELAQQLVNVGAHVGAMTPGELAVWLAEKVRA